MPIPTLLCSTSIRPSSRPASLDHRRAVRLPRAASASNAPRSPPSASIIASVSRADTEIAVDEQAPRALPREHDRRRPPVADRLARRLPGADDDRDLAVEPHCVETLDAFVQLHAEACSAPSKRGGTARP